MSPIIAKLLVITVTILSGLIIYFLLNKKEYLLAIIYGLSLGIGLMLIKMDTYNPELFANKFWLMWAMPIAITAIADWTKQYFQQKRK